MVCCMLYVHTMNNIFRSYTMYTSIICRATHIEYKIAIGHCYSYSSVNIYFQWPRQHQSCDFETPQGTAQDWSMLIWITKFLSQKVFRFLCESLMRETDLCLCGNEPAHGGGQIMIIVIVQFNWQEDPVKSYRKWHKYDKFKYAKIFIYSFSDAEILYKWNTSSMLSRYVCPYKCQFSLISSSKSQILYPRTLIKLFSIIKQRGCPVTMSGWQSRWYTSGACFGFRHFQIWASRH